MKILPRYLIHFTGKIGVILFAVTNHLSYTQLLSSRLSETVNLQHLLEVLICDETHNST